MKRRKWTMRGASASDGPDLRRTGRLFPALLPFTFRFTWCATARSLEGPQLNEAIRGSSGSVLHFERTRLAWERWRLELIGWTLEIGLRRVKTADGARLPFASLNA